MQQRDAMVALTAIEGERVTKLPDGQITQNLSSPFVKNFPLASSGKSVVFLRASHPTEGRVAIVTKRGLRCGGRGSVGAKRQSQGGSPVSDRSARGRTAPKPG
jgi:hypothetical protein